jgi:hypothetical protein
MNNNTTHPIELAILAAVVAVESIGRMLVALVAVALVVAGWRPAAAAQPPAAPWAPPAPPELEALPVAHLRKLARSAGLPRCLTHRGRRDDLLIALAVAW